MIKERPPRQERMSVALSFQKEDYPYLYKLPWHKPLMDWNDREVRFAQVKSGFSRHPVRFVRLRNRSYAIKETSETTAERELQAYVKLHELGIPALLPAGTVIREDRVVRTETPAGSQLERQSTGYVVTRVLEFALPHYFLFRRSFSKENRQRMWDAIARLFVELHRKGVYWGDASLSNMMIVFAKEHFPEVGIRTVLRAVLADAETVEFAPAVSERLRMADVEFFLESMAWTEQDMKASGVVREQRVSEADQRYLLERYVDLFEVEREEQSFAIMTKIDVDLLLGPFEMKGQAKALLQHIYEHKWYLGESLRKELSLEEAARDWYVRVFKPVLKLFDEYAILEEFPDRTAVSLYLDVMLHKYFLSERVGKDVGLSSTFESYSSRLKKGGHAREKLMNLARSIRTFFPA